MSKHVPLKILILAILSLIGLGEVIGQGRVTGIVSDGEGTTLPGVTVVVEGEIKRGTITDGDGNFSIDNLTEENVLVFSYFGFKKVREIVGKRSVISVTLSRDTKQLEDVVIIGYGSVNKEDLTGAVGSVSSEELQRTLNTSLQEGLDGRVAGVQVISGQGTPGGDLAVKVRGGTSLTASNEPLYVIDGFPIEIETVIDNPDLPTTTNGALSGIDPNDIVSIDILKDASATAIYGSRGANGVVIITTKSGKAGKGTVTYNGSISVQELPEQIEVMDAVQYAQYRSDQGAVDTAGNPLFPNPEALADRTINWQDEVYQTAVVQSHNLGFSGGNKDLTYNFSLGAFLNEGILKTSNFDRYNARLRVKAQLSPKASFDANLYGTFALQDGAPTGGGINDRAGAVIQSLRYNPLADNPDRPQDPTNGQEEGIAFDPVSVLNNTLTENERNEFYANFTYNYKITNELTFTTRVGANSRDQKRTQFWNSNTWQGGQANGRARIRNFKSKGLLNENLLTYNKRTQEHNITAVVGATYQQTTLEQFAVTVDDFVVQDLEADNLSLGRDPQIPSSNVEEHSLLSGLARVIYRYKGKYNLTASFRADGSSRFAEGNKWGYFPAAAASWNIHEEQFMSSANFINQLKVRVGYGVTGNTQIARYQSLATLSIGGYTFGPDGDNATTAFGFLRVANPDLTWETTNQWNVGLDFALLDKRIKGSVDLYDKLTEDLLLATNLGPT